MNNVTRKNSFAYPTKTPLFHLFRATLPVLVILALVVPGFFVSLQSVEANSQKIEYLQEYQGGISPSLHRSDDHPNDRLSKNSKNVADIPIENEIMASHRPSVGPLLFVENVGQYDTKTKFKIPNSSKQVFFSENEIWINISKLVDSDKEKTELESDPDIFSPFAGRFNTGPKEKREVHVRYSFVNANPHPTIEGFARQNTRISYFLGNDSTKWYSNVPVWGGIRYRDLYPGVNLEVTSENGRWKWQLVIEDENKFLLQSGLNQSEGKISLKVDGAKELSASNFSYKAKTDGGDIDLPFMQIVMPGEKTPGVIKNPSIKNNKIGVFSINVPNEELSQIDPSTMILGQSLDSLSVNAVSTSTNSTYTIQLNGADGGNIAVDKDGTAYVVGGTNNEDFPVTTGEEINLGIPCLDPSRPYCDTFVAKINPNGDILYLTFLGGSGEDLGTHIDSDDTGAVYIGGYTGSPDFPGTSTYNSRYEDVFVSKLDSTGSLLFTTILSGTPSGQTDYPTNHVYDLLVNSENDVFLLWYTWHYPATSNIDYWLTKLNKVSGSSLFTNRLSHSSYYLAFGPNGYVYVLGKDAQRSGPIYLNKYASGGAGSGEWTFNFGTGSYGEGLYVDKNNYIYISGGIQPVSGSSQVTPFVFKVKPDGTADIFQPYSQYGTIGGILMSPEGDLIAYYWRWETPYSFYVINSENLSLKKTISAPGIFFDIDENGFIYATNASWGGFFYYVTLTKQPGPYNQQFIPEFGIRDGGAGGSCPNNSAYPSGQKYGGDPINTRTGNEDYSYPDLSLTTYAGSLDFQRWYSTAAITEFHAPLGYGWANNQDIRLTLPVPGENNPIARIKLDSTNEFEFRYNVATDTFTAFPGFFGILTKHVNGTLVTYTLKTCNQWIYTFDSNGKVLSYLAPQGKGFFYEYDSSGNLHKIRDNNPDAVKQRWIELTYFDETGQRLQSIQDHSGRQVRYEYDANGDLQYVYGVTGQKWVYTYESHRLTSAGIEVQTSGGPQVRIVERTEYENGRAVRQYNGNNELVVALNYGAQGLTTVTDALGHVSFHQYNSLGTLVGQINALGNASSKTYDAEFRPTTVEDVSGYITSLIWKDQGMYVTDITSPDGSQTHLDYNESNNLTNYVDPLGNLSHYEYTGPLLASVTDALNHTTAYDYTTTADAPQPVGLLKTATDPLGQVTEYHYDAFGQIEWVRQNGLQTTNAYDSLGRLKKTVDPTGSVTQTCYDAAGQITRTVSSPSETVNDPCDFATFQRRPEDQVSDSYYDALGNVIGTVSPEGLLTRTYYDQAGRVTRVTRNLTNPDNLNATVAQLLAAETPWPHQPSHPDWNLTDETDYDAAGNMIAKVDVNGTITRTYYDALNRVEYIVQNLVGQAIDVNTPPIGGQVSGLDLRNGEENIARQMVYDRNSNVVATIQLLPGCFVTRDMSTLLPSPACVVSRTYYDSMNRTISNVQNWKGVNLLDEAPPSPVPSQPDQDLRSDTVYDLAGNAIATIAVLPGCTVSRSKDAQGHPVITTSGNCMVDRTYYDALNRSEFTVRNLVGKALMDPAYDGSGQLTLLDLSRSADQNLTTQTVYDAVGQSIASIAILPGCTVTRSQNTAQKFVYTTNSTCVVHRTYYDGLGRVTVSVQNLTGQAVDESYRMPPAYDPSHPDQNVPGNQSGYDGIGRTIASIDPLGRVTRTYLDALNRPAQTTRNLRDPNNPGATVTQLLALATPPAYDSSDPAHADWNVTGETRYDAAGRAIASIDPAGQVTRTYYDALGRGYRVTRNLHDPNNPSATIAQLLALAGPPAYDPAHPDWNLTRQTIYDAAGQAIAGIDEAKEGCTVSRAADGSVTTSAACRVSRSYYDVLGRAYAVAQNLTGQAISAPTPPATATSDANLVTYSLYNAAGQVLATVATSPACTVSRNPGGSVTIGAGCVISRSYYDGQGRVINTVQNLSGQSYLAETPPARDPAHPEQNVRTDTIYDSAGNRSETVDPNGGVTHFGYDPQNRLTDVYENYRPGVNPTYEINVHTQYTYDAQGNRLSIRSARAVLANSQAVTSFTYDKLGRLTGEQDPLGHGASYGYDILGQRATQTDAYGAQTGFSYDGLGRLALIDYPSPDADVTFSYSPTDLRLSMSDGQGTTTWTYDGVRRVSAVTDPFNQTVRYGYDGQNNRTTLTYPDQKAAHYTYDGLQRLQTVTDWQNRQTNYTYGYDASGHPQLTRGVSGITSTSTFDALGRLTDLTHAAGTDSLAAYHYTYDPSGNRTQAVEAVRQAQANPPAQLAVVAQGYLAIQLAWPDSTITETGYRLERSTDNQQHWQRIADLPANTLRYLDEGLARHTAYGYRLTPYNGQGDGPAQTVETETGFDPVDDAITQGPETTHTVIDYRYDPLARLTAADYSTGPFFHYEYDANGNRTQETTPAGAVEAVYTNNKLSSITTGSSSVDLSWDNNGNLLNDGTASYQYNAANQLIEITRGNQHISYQYNGLGARVGQTVDGQVTNYTLDQAAGLTQVLSDGTSTYLYGNERMAQYNNNVPAYFLTDALGSVRQLVDSSGTITLAQDYEPYGEVLNSAGSGSSSYGFTGEAIDGTGLIYLRARYMAPSMGRFMTQDVWEGNYYRPMSYNAWLYTYGNPINMVDPSGHDSYCDGPYAPQEDCPFLPPSWGPSLENYNEKIRPAGITFIGVPLSSPRIYNNGKLVPPGTDFSQQMNIGGTVYGQLCGIVSFTAELTRVYPGISVNSVITHYARAYGGSAVPNDIDYQQIEDFMDRSDFLKSIIGHKRVLFNYELDEESAENFRVKAADDVRNILAGGNHLWSGIRINGGSGQLTQGWIKNGSGNAPHWIVITGISSSWTNERYEKKITRSKNWIRIYNPFDNETEYYWWGDFWRSWTAAQGGSYGLSIQLSPKSPPWGLGIPDCR